MKILPKPAFEGTPAPLLVACEINGRATRRGKGSPRSGENAVKTASVGDPQRRQHGSHRLNFSSGGTVPGAAGTANLNRARGLAPFHSGHRMVIGRSIAPRASTVILAMPLQRSVLPDMHYPPKRYATLQERPLGRHLFLGLLSQIAAARSGRPFIWRSTS